MQEAKASERLRFPFGLRTSKNDNSQRMLNEMQPGTTLPIHRHLETFEAVVCLEGCMDWIFYKELPDVEAGRSHDGESAVVRSGFKEVARFRVCPPKGLFGAQVPKMVWHSI